MRRTICRWITALGVGGALLAQPPSPRPAYEVASIKPNNSGSGSSSSHGSEGQVVFTNQTLKRLIERAYEVKPFQVTGPDWMETVHFDISAKYPPDAKNEDRSLMLRTLLQDSFKLAVHRESKETSGYALVAAKGGLKLKPVEPGGSSTNSEGGNVRTLIAKKVSMPQVADFASRDLGEIVVDKTGIDGVYDFQIRWTKDEQVSNDLAVAAPPTLFIAIQETLGLRLQPQKVPVDIVVVDHVERVPVEN